MKRKIDNTEIYNDVYVKENIHKEKKTGKGMAVLLVAMGEKYKSFFYQI